MVVATFRMRGFSFCKCQILATIWHAYVWMQMIFLESILVVDNKNIFELI